MNGLSVMKRTASTSSNIFAVSSAITALSGKPVIVISSSPPPRGEGSGWGSRSHAQASMLSRNLPTPTPPSPQGGGRLAHHLPLDGLAAAIDQGALVGAGDFDFFRRAPRRLLQRDFVLVRRHPIMLRAVERGEGFQLVECAFLLEYPRIGLDRKRRIEHAGHAVGRDFPGIRMRRGIGAEKI